MFQFLPFQEKHLTLFRRWLATAHVKPFWQEPESDQELKEKFLVALPKRSVMAFIIEKANRPIGFIQYYDATKVGGGWWENEKPGTFGVDVMIGEEGEIGKGQGQKVLEDFISFLQAKEPTATSVIIDPDPKNRRAVRAFEKAGFKKESEIETPNGAALLMRFELKTN
jgi:RimJ/RimL family protein N-acetyltransferase